MVMKKKQSKTAAKETAAADGAEGEPSVPPPKKLKKAKKVADAAPTKQDASHVSEKPEGKAPKKRKNSDGAEVAPTEAPAKAKKKRKKSDAADAADAAAADAGEDAPLREEEDAAAEAAAADASGKGGKTKKAKKPREGACEGEDEQLDEAPANEEAADAPTKTPDSDHPRKVFVNGLPWNLQRETVQRDFEQCGKIERLDLPKNKLGLSSGVAFLYFATEEGVSSALKLHGTDFHGRAIKVMRAIKQDPDRKRPDGPAFHSEELTVAVHKLPPTCDNDSLKKFFNKCGEVEAVRLAKKKDGSLKGLGFVVFKTKDAVEEALELDGAAFKGVLIEVKPPKKISKEPEGAAGKGKGRGKGSGKGKGRGGGAQSLGIIKDSRRRVCYQFTIGKCCFGPNCRYRHPPELAPKD
eukprot:TRINITY_DN113481_c0_g1_i1.p1 TRINITY_DN113481_c0_g1~~TRINITY_DN113481_c0_g1_i1.p1  ORF type:complete len:458 (+),score=144.86 TRINITY_DN113481_c0_g1_i1:147-1376(+)